MSERKKDDLDQTDSTLERLEQEVQCKEEQSGDKPNRDVQIEEELQQIRQALKGLRFGQVTIVMHDGAMVQIERTEKRRIRYTKSSSDR
ncbi:MAG: putative small protein [Planctomycetota bacterium]|jgi:hypothetical protein